jgi:hypothetical protein
MKSEIRSGMLSGAAIAACVFAMGVSAETHAGDIVRHSLGPNITFPIARAVEDHHLPQRDNARAARSEGDARYARVLG